MNMSNASIAAVLWLDEGMATMAMLAVSVLFAIMSAGLWMVIKRINFIKIG